MNLRVFAAVSALLNLILLGAWFVRPARHEAARADGESRGGAEVRAVTNRAPVRPANAGTGIAAVTVAAGSAPLDWRVIESEDYRKYIANLRAIHCPEETIRDVIIADVNKLYASRRAQIEVAQTSRKYWQGDDLRTWDDPVARERQRKINEIEGERKALIKELLGVDYQTEAQKMVGGTAVFEQMYGFLPSDKRERVQNIVERASLAEQELYQDADGDLSSEQRARLKQLREEARAALAQTLSPAELEEYDLRNSGTANAIRSGVVGVDLSEEEFKKIFRIRKNFDDRSEDLADGPARDAAKKELDAQLRLALGERRFAEYQRGQDADFQQLYRTVQRYDLPGESAAKLYEIKKAAEEQRRALENNTQLIGEQRDAAMKAMSAEVVRGVKGILGEKGFKYLQSRGGDWLLVPGE